MTGLSTQSRTGLTARVTGESDPGTRSQRMTGDQGEEAVVDQVGEEELLVMMR